MTVNTIAAQRQFIDARCPALVNRLSAMIGTTSGPTIGTSASGISTVP